MTAQLTVLVIEDDDSQFETYEDGAEEYGEANNVEIKFMRGKKAEDAIPLMAENDFDGAIIDLNLDSGNPEEASGNSVLSEIKRRRRFPVLVVSGNLGNIDSEHEEDTSALFRLLDRDIPNEEIFSIICGIHKTGIVDILGGRGGIEKKLGEIFWSHLAKDMDCWIGKEGQANAFLRYTVSHLLEYLDLPSEEEHNLYNEAEFYIKPPIREHIAPGDIVKKGNERYVVLSPACDIAVREINEDIPVINAERITLYRVVDINRENFLKYRIINEGDNTSKRESKLGEIIKGQNGRYGFLPRYMELSQAIIDFQNIYTATIEEFVEDYDRMATISGQFLKDIQARVTSYQGRPGQPDLDKKQLIKEYKRELKPVN